MHFQNMATIGIVALALAAGGCNRDAGESRDTTPAKNGHPPLTARRNSSGIATKKSHDSTSACLTSNETTRRRIRRLLVAIEPQPPVCARS